MPYRTTQADTSLHHQEHRQCVETRTPASRCICLEEHGEKGRALDGLKWSREDCGPDGTHPSRTGQEKVARKEGLIQALAAEPAVRSEVLERARKLATDPNYPPADVLEKLAERFIGDAKRSK